MEKIFHSLCIILDSKVLQNFHLQMLVLGYQKQFQTLNRKQKCQISRKYLTTHIDTHTHRLTEPETLILIFCGETEDVIILLLHNVILSCIQIRPLQNQRGEQFWVARAALSS